MQPISQFELEQIAERAASGLGTRDSGLDRRSADRRPDLTLPQLAQVVGFLLASDGDRISLPCIAASWRQKRRLVIEHWCDAMLYADGKGPRNASPVAAQRTMLPPLPYELVGFAGNAAALSRQRSTQNRANHRVTERRKATP